MMIFSKDPIAAGREMRAVIYYLTAFGYVDREFAFKEKDFVQDYIAILVKRRVGEVMPGASDGERHAAIAQFTAHFLAEFAAIDNEIKSLFTESVGPDETVQEFVYAKLQLHCFEIFKQFDEHNRRELWAIAEELIQIDNKLHPAELKFRDQVLQLLDIEPRPATGPAAAPPPKVAMPTVETSTTPAPRFVDHPFFTALEFHYALDPKLLARQVDADLQLVRATMNKLEEQKAAGAGKLRGVAEVGALAGKGKFLDGHVYVVAPTPGKRYELIVLGDLHGCYSCLKAAIMQSDFFTKVQAFRDDPARVPEPKLIFLGDYIDRGRFSYNGILRTAMQLFLSAPEQVYVLRGNHEWYVDLGGWIRSGVHPAEAIATMRGHAPNELFDAYRELFEAMPGSLIFDRLLFVHAGIPRDQTLRDKWRDLSSLNDAEIRFQMMWSDPSEADYIPDRMQANNARFPFGRLQFERFMAHIGCTTLVRGHEKINEGFKSVYGANGSVLLNVFSSGGRTNDDLPKNSSYRDVTPMALTMMWEDGQVRATPWRIDYERYNDPACNALLRNLPEIDMRSE